MKAMMISFEALLGAEFGMLLFSVFIAATYSQVSHLARVSSEQGTLMSEYALSQQAVSSIYGLDLNYSSSIALISALSNNTGLEASIVPMDWYGNCSPGRFCRIVEIDGRAYVMVVM
ncbi:MAG: hypothetical protein KGH69_00940 [Candidatus Micrarchaeota archaeon]|nr:hypothetical protein [Candidatus Micrarchaeota archaeon]